MTDFKVGDRVSCWGYCCKGIYHTGQEADVIQHKDDGAVHVVLRTPKCETTFHPKQLRRLKRKEYPVPERIWVNILNPSHIDVFSRKEHADGSMFARDRIGSRAWPYILDRKGLKKAK